MKKTKPNKLLDANTAVESYLDNLLQEATESTTGAEFKEGAENKKHNVHVLATPLTQATLSAELIAESSQTSDKSIGKVELETIDVLDENPKIESNYLLQTEQLEFPVQCLMFKVKGHLLALPLIQMGSVVPFDGRLTQLPHSPEYFKGLLKHRENNVRVADTSLFLMGINKNQRDTDFSPSHLLVFKREDWAISCDELLDVVTLNEDDVKWHSNNKNRLSLGTIKKTLALILSPDAICNKLINADGRQ